MEIVENELLSIAKKIEKNKIKFQCRVCQKSVNVERKKWNWKLL